MQVAIIISPVFGKWPVVEVYLEQNGRIRGWEWTGGNRPIAPVAAERNWRQLRDVVTHRSHEVNHAALVEVASEDAAKALLGKEYTPPKDGGSPARSTISVRKAAGKLTGQA